MTLKLAEEAILNALTLRAKDILKVSNISVKSESKLDKEKVVHVDIWDLLPRDHVRLVNEAWL